MYNNPSSNFGTVVFLVLVFMGSGLLLYHCYDITVQNQQLEETVGTLQASVDELNVSNAGLKSENATLQTENVALKSNSATLTSENTTLTTENAGLESENVAFQSENTALKSNNAKLTSENTTLTTENAGLKLMDTVLQKENSKLKTVLPNEGAQIVSSKATPDGSSNGVSELLQSNFLPNDFDSWMKWIDILLIASLLFAFGEVCILVNKLRKKGTLPQMISSRRILPRKSQNTNVIESHFVGQ